ncbi:MAG: MBL fold metallo-hydrolase [Candidatus Riflebacteria bacterium]|nr:MBL fold metallo-hydrolase [Candidatus Riflebacteria bacterium]
MYVKFWGVRGSVPVPGKDTIFFGGNTTCVEIHTSDNQLMVIDAGTGIRLLGNELLKGDFGKGAGNMHLFFTHTHWDHIQGFPFFMPAYIGERDANGKRVPGTCNHLSLYGASDVDKRLDATLRGQMEHFYFPVDLEYLNASISFHSLEENSVKLGNVRVSARKLKHPNGVLGYRFEDAGKVFAFATDCEHPEDGSMDPGILDLAKDADVLVYDAQYTPEEYNPALIGKKGLSKVGWGHSTPVEGAKIATVSNVKKLFLTHHDPLHNDDQIHNMEKMAQELFPNSLAAYEGLVLDI